MKIFKNDKLLCLVFLATLSVTCRTVSLLYLEIYIVLNAYHRFQVLVTFTDKYSVTGFPSKNVVETIL